MAAVNFPNSPSVNDTHTSSGSTWKWDGVVWQRLGEAGPQGAQGAQGRQGAQGHQGVQGAGGATGAQGVQGSVGVTSLTMATGAPSSPDAGDMWWDSDDGDLHIYYNDGNSSQWVNINAGPAGAQGAQGFQGAAGAQGVQGRQGAAATNDKIEEGNTKAEVIDTGSDGQFKVETEGTERLRIASDGDVYIHNFSDNIGSSSSGEGFEFRAGEALRLQRSEGQALIVNRVTDDGDIITLRRDGTSKADLGIRANALTFDVGGTERLRIDSSGRLLIGHTSSTGQDRNLQVIGTDADSSSIQLIRQSADGSSPNLDFAKSRNATKGSNTVVQSGDNLGSIIFRGDDGTDLNSTAASIMGEVDGTPGSNEIPGRLSFRTTKVGETTASERLRITQAGRVLIGTTDEGHGNADDLTIATAGQSLGHTGITIRSGTSSDGNIFFSDATSGDGETKGAIKYSHNGDSLRFHAGGEEILRIGASSTELLRISGPIDASTQQEFGIGIAVNDAHTHPAAKITFKEFDASDSRGDLLFYTRGTNSDSASTERLRITSDGKLVTNSTSSIDCGVGGMHLYLGAGARDDYSTTADGLIIEKDGSTGISIDPGSSGSARIYFPNESNHSIASISHDNSNGEFRIRGEDHIILSTNNNTERLRINSDGTVNIGGANEVQLDGSNDEILHLHGAIVGADVDHAFGMRIDLDDDDTGTTSADRERGSIYALFNGNCTGGDTSNETRIWNIFSNVDAHEDYDLVYGVYSDIKSDHSSGSISEMRGVYSLVQNANSGNISNMTGVYGLVQSTTGANSETVNDMIGVRGRVNMCAGTSTANATDVVAVWGNIDNDNDTAQASGGKCALFYGSYDKTTGLASPYGLRIDTDVPNYLRGDLYIDGGGIFSENSTHPDHKLYIKNGTNATGILLEQTGNQYNVISSDCNRDAADAAILDIRGYWNGKQVAKIRLDTGSDTTNKDDGMLQFFTSSADNIGERIRIQSNGEVAMRSSGTPTDALANLHIQNSTFRVSHSSETTNRLQVQCHTDATDGNRHKLSIWKNSGIPTFVSDCNGSLFAYASVYAGRTRSDANSPADTYRHGAQGFYGYSARTDDDSAYRAGAVFRCWDGGDDGDRNVIYITNSGSDSVSVDYDQHQKFGVKSDGRVQGGQTFFCGRVESDEGSPNSVYHTGERGFQAYADNADDETYILARNVADGSFVFYSEVAAEANVEIEADGDARTDGTWSNTNADYAEMFEWADGNPNSEERRGMTVVLDGDKIRPATEGIDDASEIIGVVSANPVIVGDSASLGWHGRYKKDAFDAPVRKEQEFLVWYNEYHMEDGVKVLSPQPDPTNPKTLNKCQRCRVEDIDKMRAAGGIPDYAIENNIRYTSYAKQIDTTNYDSTKKYIPRQERKEWDAIGLVGKLIVKRGQPVGSRWILMKSNVGTDPNDNSIILDKYLIR